MYDNQFTGILTSVTTKGTAHAVVPATGGLGKHIIRIIHGAYQYPYLNTQQNPRPDQPVITMAFTITEGDVVLPLPFDKQGLPIERGHQVSGNTGEPVLWVDPASGPVGTELTVQLKGVGWTETANIYHLVYDNAYLGYACGFNSQGDVTIYLPLTGRPGWHFMDMYPGIYKGKEAAGVQNFRVPQLTYEADHPGERLPAFHFAVEVR